MRIPSKTSTLLVFSLLFSHSAHAYADTLSRPNVLMIIVDDMNDWVGCLNGHPDTHTPNIDRLASRGVLFANAHCAAPVCNASRVATMTGRRPSSTGIYDNSVKWHEHLPAIASIPQYFRNNGYQVLGGGKVYHHMPGFNRVSDWHDYFQQQFDGHYQTLLHANQDVSNFNFPRGYPLNQLPSVKALSRPPRNPREFDWGPLTKADLETGDGRMVGWFKQQLITEHPRPFLMIAGIYRPHLPFYAPEAYFDRVAIQDVSLPPILDRDIQDLPPGGKALAAQRREDLKLVREQGKFQEMIHAYLASVTYADKLVGELLDALDSSDAADNTIIVFWSDHGWHFGEKQHLHKMTLWERATHIPFIVSVPNGDEAGTVCGAPVSLLDIFPTLTSLCHLPELKQLDGQNLSPLLAHTDREWPYPAITTHGYNNHSVRTARWRYIRYSDGGEELYDHHRDPNEWNNLAANPKFDPIKETLRRSIPETNQPPRSKKRHP